MSAAEPVNGGAYGLSIGYSGSGEQQRRRPTPRHRSATSPIHWRARSVRGRHLRCFENKGAGLAPLVVVISYKQVPVPV
jgi:hypothetical protein